MFASGPSLPSWSHLYEPAETGAACAAPMSGCCLATLKLRVIGDGELFAARLRLNEAAASLEAKGPRSAEVKQLLRLEPPSPPRRDGGGVSRSPPPLTRR